MTKPLHIDYADNITKLLAPIDSRGRRLNAMMNEAIRRSNELVFEDTTVRMSAYHVRHADSGTTVDWHRHPFIELTWVEGGPITYESDRHEATISHDEFFIMPAFKPHRWHINQADAILHGFMLSVLFNSDRGYAFTSHLSQSSTQLGNRLPTYPEAVRSLKRAEREASQADVFAIDAAAGFLRAGLAQLLRRILLHSEESGHSAENRPPAPSVVDQAINFIVTHLSEPIDMCKVAQHVSMSTRQLNRLFQDSLGMPAGRFLLRSRLERARYLLLNSDLSIKEIAYDCGFSDPNYFSRIFRKRRGCSPGAYRHGR